VSDPEGPTPAKGVGMEIDEGTVRRIARLARIRVTDAEVKALEKELSGILDWVKQLNEVDTSDAEPMTRVTPMQLKRRADVVNDGEMADAVVKNAPISAEHFFLVPKVVE
jgi:aspartyl-tRNA(Asn)/glutamyl-tRNA(Gln) amidotransferase subunit C